jgi:hypothetical protein
VGTGEEPVTWTGPVAIVRDRPPGGVYRRRIRIDARPGSVTAAMEDDNHCFAASLDHDGRVATAVRGQVLRQPWTTCVEAVGALERFRGAVLDTTTDELARVVEPAQACTHLVDLVLLCIAHATRRVGSTQYDMAVVEPVDGAHDATLSVDGTGLLHWELDGDVVTGPASMAGMDLRRAGFGRWARAHLDAALVEPAVVLRRACQIALGRQRVLDHYTSAAELPPRALCYSQSATVAGRALRVRGSSRDFTDRPDALLGDTAGNASGSNLHPHDGDE